LLRCGKGTTFEGGLRVPAIFHWPGHIDPTAVSDELATTLDLLPTFLALSEHAVALQPDRQQQALPKFDGIDLSGLLLRNEASPRTTVIYYPQLAQQSRGVYGESVARRSLQLGLVVCIVCAHGRKTESFGRMVWCFVHTAVRVGSVKVHFKQQGSMQCDLDRDEVCGPGTLYSILPTPVAYDLSLDPGENWPLDEGSAEYRAAVLKAT
jgi:arylsulfatase A